MILKYPENKNPSEEQFNDLILLYKQTKFEQLIIESKILLSNYPNSSKLNNLIGVANFALKNLDEALSHYKKAITIKPDYAEAYGNIGNALNYKGDIEGALKSYKKSSEIKPNLSTTHYNLGNLYREKRDLNLAIQSYKKAIEITPNFAEAQNNLGICFQEIGDFKNSIASFNLALKINPKYFEVYKNLGDVFQSMGNKELGLQNYEKAIENKIVNADIYLNLGKLYQEKNNNEKAIKNFRNAIKSRKNCFEAYSNLGLCLHRKGEINSAIDNYIIALKINPESSEVVNNLGLAMTKGSFSGSLDEVMEILFYLLDKSTLIQSSLVINNILSLLKSTPTLKHLLEEGFDFNNSSELKQILKNLSEINYLIRLMQTRIIPDLQIEILISNLRKSILLNVENLYDKKDLLPFVSALSIQCFNNEYIFHETYEENKVLKSLEKKVVILLQQGIQPDSIAIICLASYRPLSDYKWSNLISFSKELKEIEKRHFLEFKEEKEIVSQIKTLNSISNSVSKEVKAQYEENPYPRWVNITLPLKSKSIKEFSQKSNLKIINTDIYDIEMPSILVAGCGTGRHPIETAKTFTKCNVFAIDLSKKSLAYAIRKTKELGLKNIEYINADILDIDALGKKFDIIETVGVLHHMEDPMAGWKKLIENLKPGGLMRIGLYSELAREFVVKTIKEIKQKDISAEKDKMREFRYSIINSTQEHHKKIFSALDSFSLSSFRDLLFHKQEIRYTLPEIKQYLIELDLSFCGFTITNSNLKEQFKKNFPNKTDSFDLENWIKFEKNYPESFRGMYQFWCQKL